jgi:hypothetical protein
MSMPNSRVEVQIMLALVSLLKRPSASVRYSRETQLW